MKRLLSLLVVIAMVVSMIPNVFAEKEEVDFDELTGRLVVLENIDEINVVLAEGSDGMIYQWTPDANYNLSLSYTAPEGTEIAVTVTQGEASAVAVDGAVSLDVWAEQLVEIEVSEAAALAAEFTISGEALAVPGSEQWSPIQLTELESTVTAAGTTFSGNTTWYAGFFAGTDLTITGTGAFNVIYVSNAMFGTTETVAAVDGVVALENVAGMPVTFAIDTVGEYTIKAEYPVGTQMNPDVLFRPNYIQVNIEEGNDQGYYYIWTTQAAGTLKLTCPTVEGVVYDVILTNQNSFAQAWLCDSTDGTVSIEMGAGDAVVIQVVTEPDDNWVYPALSTAITGEFIYPEGTQANPEILTDISNIAVDIEAGNNQGYYYTWTATETGTLVLDCTGANGAYDVIMTNMNTYAGAYLVDSTDGTISLEVTEGDVVNIQVAAIPDASWNYPALQTTIPGELVLPAPEIVITSQPESVTTAAGETVTFAVVVEGENLTYQWQYSVDGGANWLNTAVTTDTLSVEATADRNGYQYQCVITDANGNTLTSDAATLTVYCFAKQPADQTTKYLETAQFSAEFAVTSGVSYSWWYLKESTGEWTSCYGKDGWNTTTLSIEVNTLSLNGRQYRCRARYNGVDYYSDAATLYVTADRAGVTYQPADTSVISGDLAIFTFEDDSQGAATYQWQYKNTTKDVWMNSKQPGYNTNTLKVPTYDFRDGFKFKCRISVKVGDVEKVTYTEEATLTVAPVAVFAEQPVSSSIELGETATFRVQAAGEGLTYQWQYCKPNSSTWINSGAEGNTTDTLLVPANLAYNGYKFKCQIRNSYWQYKYDSSTGQVYSDTVTLKVLLPVIVNSEPENVTVAAGEKFTFSVDAESAREFTYQWQYSKDGGLTWITSGAEGAKTATMTDTATTAKSGRLYRCKFVNYFGEPSYSEAATLTVE